MIYVGNIKSNGIIYDAFYDRKSKKLKFYLNGKEIFNEKLNTKYNRKKKQLSGYNRLLTGIVCLGIMIGSYGVSALSDDTDIFDGDIFGTESTVILGQDLVEGSNVIYSNEEFLEELKKANPEFSDYIDMSSDVILRYGQYMDQKVLLDTISTLEIIESNDEKEMTEGGALAFYDNDENKIYYSTMEDSETLYIALFHEFLHYWSQSGLYDYNEYGDGYIGYALNEGMTEQLNSEFNDEILFTYHGEAAYVQALCEIIDPEVLEEAYFGDCIEMVIDELSNYTSQDEAIALIKNMDISQEAYLSFAMDGNEDDYDNFCNANERIWEIIGEMYYNKYYRDIDGDPLMNAYKTASTLTNYSSIDLSSYDSPVITDALVEKSCFLRNDDDATLYCDIMALDASDSLSFNIDNTYTPKKNKILKK